MNEHFLGLSPANSTMSIVYPAIIAACIVLLITRTFNSAILISIITLTILLYIIFTNINGSNLSGSIDPTIYPNMPHLGLGGVTLQNKYPY